MHEKLILPTSQTALGGPLPSPYPPAGNMIPIVVMIPTASNPHIAPAGKERCCGDKKGGPE